MGAVGDFLSDTVDFFTDDIPEFLGLKQDIPDFEEQGRKGNIQSAEAPQQIVFGRALKGGVMVYVNGTGEENAFLHLMIVFASNEVQRMGSIFFDSELVENKGTETTTSNAFNNAFASLITNTDNSAGYALKSRNISLLGNQTTADATAVLENANWTTDHQLQGHAYIYTRLEYDPDIFKSFIPKVTCDVYGRKDIYDPRTNSEQWTMNPALIGAWIMENLLGISRVRIDQPSLIEAANICDELVQNKAGRNEFRYTYNGYIILDGDWEAWLTPIMDCMAGAIVEWSGKYYFRAGQWRAPVLTITDADIMGAFSRTISGSDRERANAVKGKYISPESFEEPTEYPPVKDAVYIAEDGGIVNYLEKDLENIILASAAQRVGNIFLEEARRDETITIEVPLHIGLDVMPFDNVTYQSDLFGITETYSVIEHEIFQSKEVGVELTLKKHDANVYAWSSSTQEKEVQNARTVLPGVNDANRPTLVTYSVTPYDDDVDRVRVGSATFNWIDPTISFLEIRIQLRVSVEYRFDEEMAPFSDWEETTFTELVTIAPSVQTATFDAINENIPIDEEGYEFRNHQITIARIQTRINSTSYSAWVDAEVATS